MMAQYEPQTEYLDKPTLARMLNVSEKAITNWTQDKRIPFVKCGKLVRFPRAEIERRLLSGQLLTDRARQG